MGEVVSFGGNTAATPATSLYIGDHQVIHAPRAPQPGQNVPYATVWDRGLFSEPLGRSPMTESSIIATAI